MGIIAETARKLANEGNSIDVIIAMISAMEDGAKPPRKGKDGSPRAELEAVLDSTRAQAVLDHRQRIRSPLTAYAAKLLAAELQKCPDPAAAADLMIVKGWQSIKVDWVMREMERSAVVPYSGQQQKPSSFGELANFYRDRADVE